MRIEFTNPLALLLLLLIPAAIYLARHSLANLSPVRARWSLGVRVVILLLLILAIAGLRIRTSTKDVALIFVVDVSASVAPDQQRDVVQFINNEIAKAAPRDFVGVIAFGRDAAVELAPTRKEILGDWKLTELASAPSRDYTNISGALKLASALVPDEAGGRLILLSDGNENLENAMEEARILKAQTVEVHTHSLNTVNDTSQRQGEIAVRDLAAPQQLAEGEAFELKATIDSTVDAPAKLRIFRNDSLIAERDVEVKAGGENVFLLPERLEKKGFYTYRAEIESPQADTFVQNNSREAFSLIEGKPKLLYVYGDEQPSAALQRVFTEGNFVADFSRAAPTTLAGFQNYDLVIFDNLPATSLTKEQMKMAKSYVKDLGGGFIMIGGEQSFGPGGYYKTPVEDMLPVSLDVRRKKHFPSLGLVLVIDKSGSMGQPLAGMSKFELAQEAASAAVDFLTERDSVGVIAFDSQPNAVVNLKKVEDKKQIIRDIQAIQMGGGTVIYPAIKQAFEWLQASDAQIKHIIVLSDGQGENADFAGLAKTINEAGMTLSAIAVGDDADTGLMQSLAKIGGGRFYFTDRAETLPQIFTREAFLASRSTIIEEPFTPRLARSTQATNGIDWNSAPQLGGYVGTAERDETNSPAITSLIADKDDPVYAVWQYGLGRSAVFTSDAKSRWAAAWLNWSGFGQFWTQILRDTLRREGAKDLQPRVEIAAGKGHIIVEAVTPEGSFRNNLRLKAHIIAPDFSTSDMTLEQTASGRYEGDFPATQRGAYLVSVTEAGGNAAPVAGSVNSYSPEFTIANADTNLLAQLSETTGGTVLNPPASDANLNLFEQRSEKTIPQEIFATLLLIAVLLLPLDVGLRRVNISREQIEQAREWLQAKVPRPIAEVETEPALAHAQLKQSRSRVRLSDAPPAEQPPAFISQERLEVLRRKESENGKPEASPSTPKPASAKTEEAKPLSSRLIEARRKRRE